MSYWNPNMDEAPRDGSPVDLGWLPNGKLEIGPIRSRWLNSEWEGHWTPTHWRLPAPPKEER